MGTGVLGQNVRTAIKNYLLTLPDPSQGWSGETQLTDLQKAIYNEVEDWTSPKVLHVIDRKTNQTDAGGTGTADVWNDRALNTVIKNTITGASLASNIFTLPVGEYEIFAFAPFFYVNRCKLRIYNNSDSIEESNCVSNVNYFSQTGGADSGSVPLHGYIVVSGSSKGFKLQFIVQTARAGDGQGIASVSVAWGDEEYASVYVRKVL